MCKCSSVKLQPQKKDIKICERCFLCRSIEFCIECNKFPHCCSRSTCRGKFAPVLGNLGSRRGCSKGHKNTWRRLHSLLPELTKFVEVNDHHKWLCTSPQEQLPDGSIACTYAKENSRIGQNSEIFGLFQPTFLVIKSNNLSWRPILHLSTLNKLLKTEKFKMETPETIRTSLQTGECVTSIDFKDAYFLIPIQTQSRKYLCFHIHGQSYQFKALPFGVSIFPMEITVVAKEVKLIAL